GKIGQAALIAATWFIVAGFFLGFLTPRIYGAGSASLGLWTLVKIGGHVVGTVLLGTALFVLLGYLGYFTASVYPLIPAAVGGGEPRRIHLVLKSDTD